MQTETLKKDMEELLVKEIEVETQIENVQKLGQETYLIEFEKFKDKDKVMKSKYKLRNKCKRIYINEDMTKKEQKKEKQIRKRAIEEKKKGKNVKIGYRNDTDQNPDKTVNKLTNSQGKGKNSEKGQTKEIWKIGTWNIRSINGKENELMQEFQNAGLDILTVSETKKKNKGVMELENGHLLIYSGVENNKRTAAGVGCIIHQKLVQSVSKWEAHTERILTVEINKRDGKQMTVICVYGPDEDEKAKILGGINISH
ncbi:craniofacial development protein 2-like [Anoplophora glabripennis]|uniref:craniofacial development protein 2-like n=1 Tax=Anoplophora glabripennis TaxID=217634 RepID=UPI000C767C49|nr:craniofacial development protein 2-like [Anoplophora glabripennis]